MMRRLALITLLLIVTTLAAYWPVCRAGFINFDDPVYVTNNPDVFHGLTWRGVGWAFTTIHGSNWHPLTWLSHMADCSLFGENAAGHHLVNVGFHVANTLLLLLLLWRMTGAVWRSAFVAALFAFHPLHVESVAWISERKDVLSTCFAFLTLLAYVRFDEQSKGQRPKARIWYGLALVCFALGLLSKPMLVTLPFVMLLLDYWPLGRMQRAESGNPPDTSRFTFHAPPHRFSTPITHLVWEKLPFFGLAALSSAVTYWAQKAGGAVVTMEKMPLVGFALAVAWGVTEVTAGWRWQQLALGLGGGSVLAACFVCTRCQVLAKQQHAVFTRDPGDGRQCAGPSQSRPRAIAGGEAGRGDRAS